MPFDGRDNTPALNRARLIEALREEMPAGFGWDFSYTGVSKPKDGCGTIGCAVGLAFTLWPGLLNKRTCPTLGEFAEFIGVSKPDAYDTFWCASTYGTSYDRVTPAMVADALERLT